MIYVVVFFIFLISFLSIGSVCVYHILRVNVYTDFIKTVTFWNLKARQREAVNDKQLKTMNKILTWATPCVDGSRNWSDINRRDFLIFLAKGMGCDSEQKTSECMKFIKTNFSGEKLKDLASMLGSAILCNMTSSFGVFVKFAIGASLFVIFIRTHERDKKTMPVNKGLPFKAIALASFLSILKIRSL
jgi:hypothetical protein